VLITLLAALAAGAVAAVALSGCGEDDPSGLEGTDISGPGVEAVAPTSTTSGTAGFPTFRVERAKLAQRIRLLGLPPVGSEKFHDHALLHIYVDGLSVPLASGIGLDNDRKVFSSLHTHAYKDAPNVVHQEADKPFKVTLGDFFAIWGVAFGPDHLGSLKNGDGKKLRVFVNAREIKDPAAYVIKKNDKIVITFDDGKQNIDLTPDDKPLKNANSGKGGCASGGKGKQPTSCIIGDD
jgi:hypothetical protein